MFLFLIIGKVVERLDNEDEQIKTKQMKVLNGIITTICGQMGAKYVANNPNLLANVDESIKFDSDSDSEPKDKAKINKMIDVSPSKTAKIIDSDSYIHSSDDDTDSDDYDPNETQN